MFFVFESCKKMFKRNSFTIKFIVYLHNVIKKGLQISGAISLAVFEVNTGKLKDMGHSLEFLVAETYGEEVSSIRQTAALWTEKIAAYIGPQETCVHEGRMAAAFNLPMISYVRVFITLNPIFYSVKNLLQIVFILYFYYYYVFSFVFIVKHQIKKIFQHLPVLDHQIHKYQSLLFHYF